MLNCIAAAGSVQASMLAKKREQAVVASGSAGHSQQVGTNALKKPVTEKPVEKKSSSACENEKRALGEGNIPPTKKSKADEGLRPKLTYSTGKVLPSDLSVFQDNMLAHRLLRVNVLSHDYDKSIDHSSAEWREILARLPYRVSTIWFSCYTGGVPH